MGLPLDWTSLTPSHLILGEDHAETLSLHDMLRRAEEYMRSFRWCPPITDRFLAYGVAGVIALFLFQFAERINGTDDFLWVVEGDLPSAYFVTDNAPSAASALEIYCEMMEKWANAVLNETTLDGLFPVMANATPENAQMLMSRVAFIRDNIIPLA